MRSTFAAAAKAWRGVRAASTSASSPVVNRNGPPFWLAELRRYTLHPAGVQKFLDATADPEALALRHRLPFCGMWTTEAGGSFGYDGISLQTITHLYIYQTVAERTAARAALAAEPAWADFLARSRPHVAHQAADFYSVPPARGASVLWKARSGGGGTGTIYELITGIPSTATYYGGPTHAAYMNGRLVVGTKLGSRMLLYRYESLEAFLDPKLAAVPNSDPTKKSGREYLYSRALLRPVPWSPLQ